MTVEGKVTRTCMKYDCFSIGCGGSAQTVKLPWTIALGGSGAGAGVGTGVIGGGVGVGAGLTFGPVRAGWLLPPLEKSALLAQDVTADSAMMEITMSPLKSA